MVLALGEVARWGRAVTYLEYRTVAAQILAFQCDRDDPDSVTAYIGHRRAAGMSPRSLALELRIISVAMNWASRTFGVPTFAVPRVHVDPRRFVVNHRTPTPWEAASVLRAMPRDDWRVAARLIATTGARIGEVLTLRSCDVDVASGRVPLGASDGASKTGLRWFPLDAATLRELVGRTGRGLEPLFSFGGVTRQIQGTYRRLRRACEVAGVSRFTAHGFRRMVVGRLLRAQVDPATAATLAGHSIEVMLKHYREVSDEDRRRDAERAMLGVLDELPTGA